MLENKKNILFRRQDNKRTNIKKQLVISAIYLTIKKTRDIKFLRKDRIYDWILRHDNNKRCLLKGKQNIKKQENSFETKKKLLNCYVASILFYGNKCKRNFFKISLALW